MSAPALIESECATCGDMFGLRPASEPKGWGLYCSRDCKAKPPPATAPTAAPPLPDPAGWPHN